MSKTNNSPIAIPPREEFTQIRIDITGTWYTGGLKIINPKILLFFKTHLYRDKKGIYIYNTFGEFSEKGYIKIEGPLLQIIDIVEDSLVLENKETIFNQDAEIMLDEHLIPYAKLPRLQVWSVFSSKSAVKFGTMIEELNGQYFWLGNKIKVLSDIKWS